MRPCPPSKNCFISRYILLIGGSGIIKECENQNNGFYLKKWPLTTVLSDIQKPNSGKTFFNIAFFLKMTQFSFIAFFSSCLPFMIVLCIRYTIEH